MRAILLTLLLSGCASFEDTAWAIKREMNYVAHSPKVTEWEPLSAAKNYEGDCSNLCATLQQAFPAAQVWLGQAYNGEMHCVTCLDGLCADTIHPYTFKNYAELWRVQPIKLNI